MKEYIGVTGYKHPWEIMSAAKAYEEAGITKESALTAMYGFLIFDEQADNDSEGNRGPKLKNLPGLLKEVPEEMMPTIHLCSSSRSLDAEKAIKIFSYKNIYDGCKALQLNLDWPEPGKIQRIKNEFKDLYVILQVNPLLGEEKTVTEKTREYTGLVDKLLIDPSLGAGIEYNSVQTARIIKESSKHNPFFKYVVTGGLSHENVYKKIIDTKELIPQKFSIDAEGQLRTSDGKKLHPGNVRKYILRGKKAFEDTENI